MTITEITKITPLHTRDWYVKWFASACILIAVLARSAGIEYHMIDVWFSVIGTAGWFVVGMLWKDRALILLNSVGFILLIRNLITYISS